MEGGVGMLRGGEEEISEGDREVSVEGGVGRLREWEEGDSKWKREMGKMEVGRGTQKAMWSRKRSVGELSP